MTTPVIGQSWMRRGETTAQRVIRILPGYARLSVSGHQHRGAYIDVPLDRFGMPGPHGYELVETAA